MEENVITRETYINHLEKWREKKVIKVITGIRRAGKSSLFTMFIAHLKNTGVQENQIVYLNLEDMAHSALLDSSELYNYISARLVQNKYTYIFIDEVQNCAGFEKAINSLSLKPSVDIYLTGSNAYFLSGELATLLSGRYITIEVLPLSFKEYLKFKNADSSSLSPDSKKSFFSTYMNCGQLPYLAFINDDMQLVRDYLEGILNTIIIKDVAVREKINEILLLQKIIKCICDSVGSQVSVKKISDTLISSGRKVSVNTVEQYVRALCDSFIFYQVARFDIRGRQVLKTLEKYYIADTGLRNIMTNAQSNDFGHLVENIVYLELRRRYSTVMIGKSDREEIDFVVKNGQDFMYIQVSVTVLDSAVLERELKPLRHIKDNYPKLLLTLDDFIPEASYDGIIHKNIINWLLEPQAE
ncbi:ATP-binding protein [Treponema sp.]|uniref:ATP-binding protein n=1 Tax=Treponema sp. TaxID=166 RepID=UPI003F0B5D5D